VSHVIDPVNAGESGNTRLGPSCRPAEFEQLVMCDALTLSGLIKRREVSCVDVMTAYLDHIEVNNRSVNASVALRDRDELLAEARDALACRTFEREFGTAMPGLAAVLRRAWRIHVASAPAREALNRRAGEAVDERGTIHALA